MQTIHIHGLNNVLLNVKSAASPIETFFLFLLVTAAIVEENKTNHCCLIGFRIHKLMVIFVKMFFKADYCDIQFVYGVAQGENLLPFHHQKIQTLYPNKQFKKSY